MLTPLLLAEPEDSGPVVAPSADWQVLDKEAFDKLEKSTDRWTIVFHDSSPRFAVLNELAAWAKTHITEKPFHFGVVDVEKNVDLAKNLDVDYVPLMITVAEGQVHDYYSYLNDLPQLQAWLNGGYVISNPSGEGEAADDEFSAEELAAMEKEIAGEGGDEDTDFDEGEEEPATEAPKKEL
jgi:thioredoxin-like negative regulator of GroEL